MTFSDDSPCGRSQLLTYLHDKVVVDQKTIKRLRSLLYQCADNIASDRDCEIFLTSLDMYLSEEKDPSASKSLLLLNHYRDVVPESLEKISGWLDEARDTLNAILVANKLGGGNG